MKHSNKNGKTRIQLVLILSAVVLTPFFAMVAHPELKHTEAQPASQLPQIPVEDKAHPAHEDHATEVAEIGVLSQFPSLHPMVVHFPIVLLITAPFLLAGGLLRKSASLRLAAIAILWLGTLGALASTRLVHPHTEKLEQEADKTLEIHSDWADRTVYLSFTAAILLTASFAPRIHSTATHRILDATGFLLLLLASVSVSITGHYGAKLTHIHGVGPKGDWLEMHRE